MSTIKICDCCDKPIETSLVEVEWDVYSEDSFFQNLNGEGSSYELCEKCYKKVIDDFRNIDKKLLGF